MKWQAGPIAALFCTAEERRDRTGQDRDRGAIMAEYAYILVGIALVVGIAAAAFGARLAPLYESVVFP